MNNRILTPLLLLALLPALAALPAAAQERPNVVLILMDNFGWGELGVYGGGNASIPLETPVYGLTQWEYTMAEMFSDVGYATGMFGKWHLGHTEGRYPTDQGFDEWYGIPNSSDESAWPDDTRYRPDSHPFAHPEYIMEGRKGEQPKKLRVYNTEERIAIDGELTRRSIDFMQRQAAGDKPLFLFIPYTQTHMPRLAEEGAADPARYAGSLCPRWPLDPSRPAYPYSSPSTPPSRESMTEEEWTAVFGEAESNHKTNGE